MRVDPERCSTRSLVLGESLTGTASTIRAWVLLEDAGPWGERPLRDSRLPDSVRRELERISREHGRVLLIRRHGGPRSNGVTCFVAFSGPGRTWIERTVLADSRAVLDLDLAGIRRGQPPGLEPFEGPLYLVCTNGRRDPCCAELGRPLVAAVDERFGERTWESSHFGGDRFAGNLICLPHGIYYGRVAADEGADIAGAYERGLIDLEHYRGRSCYDFPVQAAETLLREEQELRGIDDITLIEEGRTGSVVRARFRVAADGRLYAVTVRVVAADPARTLTCHSSEEVRPPSFALVGIERA